MMKVIIAAVLALGAVGCAKPQGDDRLKERAAIEAKGNQDAVDNKAREMEARLTRQQRFFQGVAGTFVGKLTVSSGKRFEARFVLTPTIPVYQGTRVRTMDEITYDLTNLALNVEERISDNSGFATGCVYTDLKPKIDSGFILATTAECAVTFVLSLTSAPVASGTVFEKSRETTTQKVLDGEIDQINVLQVEMRSIHKPGANVFEVTRVNE